MRIRLKTLLNSDNLSFVENTASLAFIKGADMVTQLLVMPRLISILGIATYGQIAFYIVIMQYITFICDFGYNFNASKIVSENKDAKILSTVFSAVTIAKTLIILALLLIITILSIIFNDILPYKLLLYFIIFIIFSAFTLDWLYLGLQKMVIPAIIKILYRILYVFYIYRFIDAESSYTDVILLDILCPVVLTTFSTIYAICKLRLRFIKIDQSFSLMLFKESWLLFSSSVFITLYRNITVILLKLISGELYAGIYAAVEKIIRAAQAILEPISTALFPFIGKKFASLRSNIDKLSIIYKLLIIYIPLLLLIVFLIVIFTPYILRYMNIDASSAALNLYIMSVAFFSGCLNYLLGYVGLVNLNKNKDFRNSVTVVGCISLVISPLLIILFKDIGGAISLALSETILLVLIWTKFHRLKLIKENY